MNPFKKIREMFRQAVLGGIQDAMEELQALATAQTGPEAIEDETPTTATPAKRGKKAE